MVDQKAKEMEPVETQTVEIMPPDIENLIYVVRNKQVMVDSDLAMLYQVETKALNRAVKRNIKRFPEDFCFQLTTEETESLKCQSGTSKIQEPEKKDGRGGRRTFPVKNVIQHIPYQSEYRQCQKQYAYTSCCHLSLPVSK